MPATARESHFLACGFHAFLSQLSLVVIVITPDATRKAFQLTQSNRTAHCMEGIFIVHKPTSVEIPTRELSTRIQFSLTDGDSLTIQMFSTFFFLFMESGRKETSTAGKWWWFFFNALASSLLRALRNFQFLFCALSIQCRMANVAAWIKQIVYTLITTHSPG